MTGSLIAEHAGLEALLRAVAAACAAGGAGDAQTACNRLEQGLEEHLDREESLYFPPISALRPDRRGALERLLEGHREIRGALARLQGRLAERFIGPKKWDGPRYERAIRRLIAAAGAGEARDG